MPDLIYLYGWVPDATAASQLGSMQGIADRPVEFVQCGDAFAAISRVPADAYTSERIEERLADLHWLGDHGLAHERIVAALVDRGTVLPMRLFTLFSSEAALRDECEQRRGWIGETLARLDGLREWDLKVSYESEKALATVAESSAEVAQIDAELATATPGRRYLLQKRRDDVARSEVRRAVTSLGEEVLTSLSTVAAEVKRVAPPANADPTVLPVILAAALLVGRDKEDALRERLVRESERLAPRGVSIACAGPWAAYRFIGA